MPHISRLL